MDELIYWIWLSASFKSAEERGNLLLKIYKSPKAIYEADPHIMLEKGYISKAELKLLSYRSFDQAEKTLELCRKRGIELIPQNSEFYPDRLRNIYAAPILLYTVGNKKALNEKFTLGVVGTRSASDYSLHVTDVICKDIAKEGIAIVSGCAVGIDAQAHLAALYHNAVTIAVMGCGLDINYPKENFELKKAIIKRGGVLVSEYPPQTEPYKANFPHRNRILAGLSDSVLVTQVPKRSGASITADLAVEQGKDLFCVPPHDITSDKYSGVVKYLRDGAIPVFDASDILLYYYINEPQYMIDSANRLIFVPDKEEKQSKSSRVKTSRKKEKAGNDSSEAQTQIKAQEEPKTEHSAVKPKFEDQLRKSVYQAISGGEKTPEEISIETGMEINDILAVLSEFEILRYCQKNGLNKYIAIN